MHDNRAVFFLNIVGCKKQWLDLLRVWMVRQKLQNNIARGILEWMIKKGFNHTRKVEDKYFFKVRKPNEKDSCNG